MGWGFPDIRAEYQKQIDSGTRFETPLTDISDLAATIFSAFGIDPRAQMHDIQGQLRYICDGNPVQELF